MKVVFLEERLPDYRRPFVEQLRARLARSAITLDVGYGSKPAGKHADKDDTATLPWARRVSLHRVAVGRREITWFSGAGKLVADADLIILDQANRNLSAFWWLIRRRVTGRPLIAWWGHGANLQATGSLTSHASEYVKAHVARWADWALAYTAGSGARFRAAGVPDARVTVVNNSIDTAWADGLAEPPPESVTCAYVGSLYCEKRIDLLLNAGARIAREVPGFRLVVLGDGPQRELIVRALPDSPWLEWHGRVGSAEQGRHLSGAALILNPGLVGLVAVDSLASGRPIVTRRNALHSPEFEYLEDGVSAVVVDGDDSAVYAAAIIDLLREPDRLSALRRGCLAAAELVTLDAMVENFATGVEMALGRRPSTSGAEFQR